MSCYRDSGEPFKKGICWATGCDRWLKDEVAKECGGAEESSKLGCGGYFCGEHLFIGPYSWLCEGCMGETKTFISLKNGV